MPDNTDRKTSTATAGIAQDEMPAKRARVVPDDIKDDEQRDCSLASSLPPDIWAHAMIYLPFRDALNCTSVNKMLLKKVAPRVKQITILDKREMRVVLARRFPNVENLVIGCLYTDGLVKTAQTDYDQTYDFNYLEDYMNYSKIGIDAAVIGRITPMLSAFSSSSLKRIDIGGLFLRGHDFAESFLDGTELAMGSLFMPDYEDDFFLDDEECDELLRNLELVIGGAYATGTISLKCEVFGVRTSCTGDDTDGCALCKCYCESYPFKKVAFGHLCVSPKERIKMILKRRGGKEYFTSEGFYLTLCTTLHLLNNRELPDALEELNLQPKISRDLFLKLLSVNADKFKWCLRIPAYFDFLKSLGVPVRKADLLAASDALDSDDYSYVVADETDGTFRY